MRHIARIKSYVCSDLMPDSVTVYYTGFSPVIQGISDIGTLVCLVISNDVTSNRTVIVDRSFPRKTTWSVASGLEPDLGLMIRACEYAVSGPLKAR